MRRLPLLLAALAVSASACAEIGEPELGRGIDVAPTTVPANDTVDDEPQELVSGAAEPVFTPLRPDGYVPSIILSTDTGSIILESDADGVPLGRELAGPASQVEAPVEGETGASEAATDEEIDGELDVDGGAAGLPIALVPAALSVDDYLGGLVVQSLDGDVRWAASNSAESQLVSEGGARLLDAGFLQEALAVQVFLAVPGAVDRVGVADGIQQQFTQLAAGEEIIDFASSNGIQALVIGNDRCGEIRFLNASGEAVDIGGPGAPRCIDDRRPRFGSVALGPDGDRVVYTQIEYRDDGLPASTEVVLLEVSSSSVLFAGTIGASGEQIESLAYDGRRALFVRTDDAGRQAGLIDISTGAQLAMPSVAGLQAVSFARLPLAPAALPDGLESEN